MFFKKTECLASVYKSGKLPKKKTKCVCVCIYIYNYFILIINYSLNKRFCKKIFGFNISLFKKCYIYNIFTILWTSISQIYFILLIYLLAPCPTPNPTQPISLFFFSVFFSFFPSIFPQPRANPTPFVTPQLN